MKNSIFNAVCKTRYLALLVVLILTCGNVWGAATATSSTSTLKASTSYYDLESGKLIEVKNSANNSYSNPLRIYANNTFTFHCKSGATKITKIEITANSTSYASTTKSATWSASGTGTCSASASVSSSTVTVTVTGTATTVTVKPSAQIRWNKVVVTYEEAAAATKTYHEWNGSSQFTTSTGGSTLKAVPSLCDWAIEPIGWCSEETYASGSYPTGKMWSAGDSWPTGKTDLYALYRVGSDPYYYSTKPTIYTITYNLTNVTKDDEFSYSCMSDMVDEVGTSNFYGYFKPNAGYTLDESCINITMGGSPVSSSNYSWNPEYSYAGYDYTAELYMESITGNVVVTVTAKLACDKSVTIATGSPTNCTISASAASVSTCSGTRQVTISVTPNSCYAAPVKASVTSSGTTATWVSGPTLNSGHYDYVYSFAENATGTTTFNASLSTKTTYTISYAAGSVPSGGGSITGSHVNDTKTCGTSMPLPGETFHTTGYTQTGWSKTNGGSQYAAVGGSYTDNAAQTFYPVWTANKYTVTWSVNGSTYQTTSNVSYNTTTSTPANPSVPGECTGSTFMGWTATQNYTSDSAPGDLFNGTSPTITGNITFYAVFADEN